MSLVNVMSMEERNVRQQLLQDRKNVDVTFLIGETQERLECHKEVLSKSSVVFEAMFRAYWNQGVHSEVSIPDTDVPSFLIFIRFMYTKYTRPTEDTVEQVIYLARKYSVPNLEKLCIVYLWEHIRVENVLRVYRFGKFMDIKSLTRRTWNFMLNNAEDFLKSKHFLGMELKTFQDLLFNHYLKAKELTVFRAAIRWAKNVCTKEKGIKCTPRNMRKVLKPVLPLIRFTLLTLKQFTKEVTKKNPGILSKTETLKLTKYFEDNMWENPAKKANLIYEVKPRGSNHHFVHAFSGITSQQPHPDHKDHFETYWFGCKNQDVSLCAIELFGATLKPGEQSMESVRIRLELHSFVPKYTRVAFIDVKVDVMKSDFKLQLENVLNMEKSHLYVLRFFYPIQFNFKFGSGIKDKARISCTPTDVLMFKFINVTHKPVVVNEGRLKGLHFRR